MVSAGPGPENQNQLAWEACMVDDDALSDSIEGGMAVEVVESVWGLNSSSKTPRRTLELAGRIGKRQSACSSIRERLGITSQPKSV